MLLKELMEQYPKYFESKCIKTHIYPDGGITGFYTKEELLEKYANRKAEIIYYEKDYGNDSVAIRDYLYIDKED